MTTSISDSIKLFGITNQMIEHGLDRIELEYVVDLKRGLSNSDDIDEAYYPQIESSIRAEAAVMAPHYEVFYSLEKAIRSTVRDQMQGAHGDDWWERKVPTGLVAAAEKRQEAEARKGFTPRPADPLDFLTFGELGEIIKFNWDDFGALLQVRQRWRGFWPTLTLSEGLSLIAVRWLRTRFCGSV